MAGQCDPLFSIREEIVEKLENINSSIEGITQNIIGAEIALAGAEVAAGLCLFTGPGALACGIAAGVAIATALAALAYFNDELEKAVEAREQAQDALDQVDGLIGHCEALESWQEEASEALLNEAPDPASIPDIEEVDESILQEAEEALAEAEGYIEEAESSYS